MLANTLTEPIGQNLGDNQKLLDLFSFGFDHWLVQWSPEEVFERIRSIDTKPIGRAQLNQLLHLCHEPGVSDGFFRYYWLNGPKCHPYEVDKIHGYSADALKGDLIHSQEHLKWGLYRLYVDALLFFGDVRIAFNKLRVLSARQLDELFQSKRFDTEGLSRRGPAIPLVNIAKDNRYLISEMACKSHVALGDGNSDLKAFLLEALAAHLAGGGGKVTIRKLVEQAFSTKKNQDRQAEFLFSVDDILDEEVESNTQLTEKYEAVVRLFETARRGALKNTDYFLSMVNDLDIYVATSMRDRSDFRKMGDFCEKVFRAPSLKHLTLRYFDPTVSAAQGHEDKGLIECLMVKSAKVLVYCAGKKDSFGKDAEAAMALSLGKPVIFYCDEAERQRFFSEIHPLSRLIEFETGIAVGAMVTSSQEEVITLLGRIFENKMEYELKQRTSGLRLVEKLTGSTVRLQTRNSLLRETFWNYYHKKV
jgi:hypothetical protein